VQPCVGQVSGPLCSSRYCNRVKRVRICRCADLQMCRPGLRRWTVGAAAGCTIVVTSLSICRELSGKRVECNCAVWSVVRSGEKGMQIKGVFQCLPLLLFIGVLSFEMEGVFESRVSERYSGRPNTLHLDDFFNRLEAAFHKAKLKEKRLQRAEFLRLLPTYLEHEVLLI
jgi:hypothetical protein